MRVKKFPLSFIISCLCFVCRCSLMKSLKSKLCLAKCTARRCWHLLLQSGPWSAGQLAGQPPINNLATIGMNRPLADQSTENWLIWAADADGTLSLSVYDKLRAEMWSLHELSVAIFHVLDVCLLDPIARLSSFGVRLSTGRRSSPARVHSAKWPLSIQPDNLKNSSFFSFNIFL